MSMPRWMKSQIAATNTPDTKPVEPKADTPVAPPVCTIVPTADVAKTEQDEPTATAESADPITTNPKPIVKGTAAKKGWRKTSK